MIDPFSISFLFDDRNCGNLNIMREEMKEAEERKKKNERKIKEDFTSLSNQLQV